MGINPPNMNVANFLQGMPLGGCGVMFLDNYA